MKTRARRAVGAATRKIMIEIKPLSEMRDRGRTNSASLDDFTFAPPRARGSFGSVTEMGDALEALATSSTEPAAAARGSHSRRRSRARASGRRRRRR